MAAPQTGTGYRLELKGHGEAIAALERAADRLMHPAPLFDAIGALLVASTQLRFERGLDPDGDPWPPSLRVLIEGGKTLIDSGELVASITHEADDAGVAVGTNSIKAGPHQFGATIRPVTAEALAFEIGGAQIFARSVTIPRRAFLGIDEDDEAMIIAEAEEFVLAPFEPAGGADAR